MSRTALPLLLPNQEETNLENRLCKNNEGGRTCRCTYIYQTPTRAQTRVCNHTESTQEGARNVCKCQFTSVNTGASASTSGLYVWLKCCKLKADTRVKMTSSSQMNHAVIICMHICRATCLPNFCCNAPAKINAVQRRASRRMTSAPVCCDRTVCLGHVCLCNYITTYSRAPSSAPSTGGKNEAAIVPRPRPARLTSSSLFLQTCKMTSASVRTNKLTFSTTHHLCSLSGK